MDKPFILIGYGGHGRVVADLLGRLGCRLLGYVAPEKSLVTTGSAPNYLGTDAALDAYPADEVLLANAVGSIGSAELRRNLFLALAGRGFMFPALVHPAAILAGDVSVGAGSQVMAGAVVQTGTTIGENAIVNTAASIDHDCHIGNHCHLAPGCVLSGGVTVGEGAHIGAGAVVIQSLSIGAGAIIGAGSTVLNDVPPGTTVVGSPARPA